MTISVGEAAKRLGISRNGAYVIARRGDLPGVRKIPGLERYVVYEPELQDFIEGRQTVPTTA